MKVWTGIAGDPFFLDAVTAREFIDTALETKTWDAAKFSKGNGTTGATNVLSIVVELPLNLISDAPFGFLRRFRQTITGIGRRSTGAEIRILRRLLTIIRLVH